MLVLEGMFLSQPQLVNVQLSAQADQQESPTIGRADCNFVLGTSALRLSAHPCLTGKRGLDNKQEVCPGSTTCRGLTGKANEKAQTPSRGLNRAPH